MSLRDRLGCNIHLANRDQVNLAAQLGCTWVRVDLCWNLLEPYPGEWHWEDADETIMHAKAQRLHVFATIAYTPSWLTGGQGKQTPPPIDKWQHAVETIATKYHDQVDVFGIWNEANRDGFFRGSVYQYVDHILKPAAERLRTILPHTTIAAPDLSTEGDWPTWLKICLERGRDSIDVVTTHSYAKTGLEVWRALVQQPRWYEFWKKPSVWQVIQDSGCGDRPWWVTEIGWNTRNVTLQEQRDHIEQVLEKLEYASKPDGVLLYQLIDESPDMQWGLYRQDMSAKPAVSVVRDYAGSPVA